MSVLLGLLAAATYGSSDFLAGLASRRLPPIVVTAAAQAVCLVVGVIAVAFYPGDGMSGRILVWGVASGLGAAGGTFALYRGLGGGEMSIVATLSGLLTAVIPVIVGLATGDSLSAMAAVGIVAAIPAIGLVSWQSGDHSGAGRSDALWGILAGLGFGLLFVGYDRAGSGAGGWPLVVAEGTATLLTLGPALVAVSRLRRRGPEAGTGEEDMADASASVRSASRAGPVTDGRTLALLLAAGLLAGIANLSFVVATHHGELAVVAVLTALYPGFTVILARLVLGERWSSAQKLGLATALVATFLVSLGSA
ncbi:MAG TPA: DMT family transporter [Solirubrobacterales bacterium]|nr:DMT family transporter [Solirubrobacterales bacterium]